MVIPGVDGRLCRDGGMILLRIRKFAWPDDEGEPDQANKE